MEFFKRKKDKLAADAAPRFTMESMMYNHAELEKKAKEGKPMTFEENEALRKYRQKDVSNQVLRLVGLLAILVVVIFAVGTFLYPYSIFNIFGNGNKFWDCWNNIGVYLGKVSMDGELVTLGRNGWVTLGEIYNGVVVEMDGPTKILYCFAPEAPALMNFFVLGGWTIIPLATIGFISILIFAVYMLVYNIKDLILVVKHLNNKTKGMVSELAHTAKETAIEVSDKPAKKTRKRKPKTEVEVETANSEEKELEKKLEDYKKELIEEDTPSKISDLKTLSNDDLDKLLQ